MGVPAMMRLLRTHSFSSHDVLRESPLIVDCTDSMYWFIKANLTNSCRNDAGRMDRFGFNLSELDTLMRYFFALLMHCKVRPIVVYDGATPSENKVSALASKRLHFERSARIRMYLLQKNGERMDHTVLPKLAGTVIKQVVRELGIEAHQSSYEVYPILLRLAKLHRCPVFTSHSDFILSDAPRGFILAEQFRLLSLNDPQLKSGLPVVQIHHNRLLLNHYNLNQASGSALNTLYVLLRPDFAGRYYRTINKLLRLPQSLSIRHDDTTFENGRAPHRGDPCFQRIEHVLTNWSDLNLTSPESVRNELNRNCNGDRDLLRDYDAIYESFTEATEFGQQNELQSYLTQGSLSSKIDVNKALTERDSLASFSLDILMNQTNISRGRIEDTETFRSTHSLYDPVKQFIIDLTRQNRIQVLDRQYSQLEFRYLTGSQSMAASTDQLLHDLFLYPSSMRNRAIMQSFIGTLLIGKVLPQSYCSQLLTILCLANYGFELAFRSTYDNSRTTRNNTPNSDQSLTAASVGLMSRVEDQYRPFKVKLLRAVYNCFIFYAFKTKDETNHDNKMINMKALEEDTELQDSTGNEDGWLPKIRMASNEIENLRKRNPDISDTNYIKMKHCLEVLNSSIYAYCELISLYDSEFPKHQLKIGRYYDGVLIYKIIKHLSSAKGQTTLLQIETRLASQFE